MNWWMDRKTHYHSSQNAFSRNKHDTSYNLTERRMGQPDVFSHRRLLFLFPALGWRCSGRCSGLGFLIRRGRRGLGFPLLFFLYGFRGRLLLCLFLLFPFLQKLNEIQRENWRAHCFISQYTDAKSRSLPPAASNASLQWASRFVFAIFFVKFDNKPVTYWSYFGD